MVAKTAQEQRRQREHMGSDESTGQFAKLFPTAVLVSPSVTALGKHPLRDLEAQDPATKTLRKCDL